jgi:hypothetical protein
MNQRMNSLETTSGEYAVAVPPTVKSAFWMASIATVLSLLAPVVAVFQAMVNHVPPDVLATYRRDAPQATAGAIKTTVVFAQTVSLGVYVTAAAIVVFVAIRMKAGKGWARWATTALLLSGAALWSTRNLGSPLDTVVKVMIAACALAAIAFMFVRKNRLYFRHGS